MTTNSEASWQSAHLIACEPRRDETAPTWHAMDPRTGAQLSPAFSEATAAEVREAVRAATAAFEEHRSASGEARAAFIDAIADEIAALASALIERAQAETGLPAARLEGERTRTVNQIRAFARIAREGSWVSARIDTGDPTRTPLPKPDVRACLVPMGPVAVFGASNFPLAISVAGTDTVSALAIGCPVIVKAHPGHPGTSAMVGAAIARAARATKMPPGVFSLLFGRGHEVGLALVREPGVTAVAFTGSVRGGRALFDAAAARPDPIPVFAEMGSVNPVFVMPRALAARGPNIARSYVQSLTLGVGQFCTNPGLLFITEGEGQPAFREALAQAAAAVPPASMLTAGIYAGFREGVEKARSTPGVAVAGRSAAEGAQERSEAGCVVLETTLANLLEHPHLTHECFGPSSLVVRCPDEASLQRAASMIEGQLAASVFGTPEDLAGAGPLLRTLETKVGRLIVDGFATGIEVCAAMQHGGPYPSTTSSQHTSIGHAALFRFARPVAYQDAPDAVLPPALQRHNPLGIVRYVDGKLQLPSA